MNKLRGVSKAKVVKATPNPPGRAISMLGPLDDISDDQMARQVGNIYIVSCHGCRTGTSFEVGKDISVVSTSRHQYKASSPIVVKERTTYSVIEPTKTIARNVADATTISELIKSIRNSIVPEVEPAMKKHALSKGTRAVIKMRNSASQPMRIPESQLFVAGKKISGYEGVFLVNKLKRRIDDVTAGFGLIERTDRTLVDVTPPPHPQHDSLSDIIVQLKGELNWTRDHYKTLLSNLNPTPDESLKQGEVKHYIEGRDIDIKMLETELKNESVLGKYKYVAQGTDGTSVERDVLFSDIANHRKIQDGDVIILHVCNSICDQYTGFRHGESTAVRNAKMEVLGRIFSSNTGQTDISTGLVFDPNLLPSDGEMGGGNSNLKTKTKRNIKRKKYKRLTVKRRALRRKLRRSRNRSYRKSYRI